MEENTNQHKICMLKISFYLSALIIYVLIILILKNLYFFNINFLSVLLSTILIGIIVISIMNMFFSGIVIPITCFFISYNKFNFQIAFILSIVAIVISALFAIIFHIEQPWIYIMKKSKEIKYLFFKTKNENNECSFGWEPNVIKKCNLCFCRRPFIIQLTQNTKNKILNNLHNNLESNVIIQPQNLIDEKSYKKLDKDLENIRKSKDKKYKKWVNSRKIIDNFYFENTYTLDSLYNRYIHLENNLTIFHNLKIPVLISISFGIFISFSTEVIKGLYNIIHNFIIDTNNIISDALSRTSITNEPHIIEAAEQIRNNTLIQFTVPSIAIIVILGIGAFMFFWNIKSEYTLKTYSLHLYSYEADKIKNLIDKEEERIKLSELENQEGAVGK